MVNVFESATKIVLILLALALVVWLFLGKIQEDTYKDALMLVLAFYFGQKTNIGTQTYDKTS